MTGDIKTHTWSASLLSSISLKPQITKPNLMKSKTRYIQCSDGFCGATDCPRCSPERFRGGILTEDIEDAAEPKCTCRNQDTPWHESDCPQGAAEELAQERGEEAEAATETANRGRAC